MWDPRNYADTDYGLDEDELFEPEDVDDRSIDLSVEPHIHTVLGPITPDELGICYPAEHVLTDPPEGNPDQQLTDAARALAELTSFVTAGGRAIVDATPPSRGRDVVGLFDVARRVPAHIIAATGGPDAEVMIREIREGIGPRRVRPGVIVTDRESANLSAAVAAANETHVPVILQTESRFDTADVPEVPTLIVQIEMPGADVAWTKSVVERGAFVLYTGVGRPSVGHVQSLARSLVQHEAQGYGDRILVSSGFDRRSQLHAWNGQPGLVYLLERFTLELMEAGGSAPSVRQLLVDNPARALAVVPASEQFLQT